MTRFVVSTTNAGDGQVTFRKNLWIFPFGTWPSLQQWLEDELPSQSYPHNILQLPSSTLLVCMFWYLPKPESASQIASMYHSGSRRLYRGVSFGYHWFDVFKPKFKIGIIDVPDQLFKVSKESRVKVQEFRFVDWWMYCTV